MEAFGTVDTTESTLMTSLVSLKQPQYSQMAQSGYSQTLAECVTGVADSATQPIVLRTTSNVFVYQRSRRAMSSLIWISVNKGSNIGAVPCPQIHLRAQWLLLRSLWINDI